MAKKPETLALERACVKNLCRHGIFGCREVTIGLYGHERVDFLTIDTKDIVKCYEIKVTKSDFYSKAAHTFVGHFNYFVMPWELFQEVEKDIPAHIGVLASSTSEYTNWRWLSSVKKAKRQPLGAELDIIKMSMIRSLSRDAVKHYKHIDREAAV